MYASVNAAGIILRHYFNTANTPHVIRACVMQQVHDCVEYAVRAENNENKLIAMSLHKNIKKTSCELDVGAGGYCTVLH